MYRIYVHIVRFQMGDRVHTGICNSSVCWHHPREHHQCYLGRSRRRVYLRRQHALLPDPEHSHSSDHPALVIRDLPPQVLQADLQHHDHGGGGDHSQRSPHRRVSQVQYCSSKN